MQQCLNHNAQYYRVHWNPSIVDTLGTAKNVLISEVLFCTQLLVISEVSSFQGKSCTQLYLAGTLDSVLIKWVSL